MNLTIAMLAVSLYGATGRVPSQGAGSHSTATVYVYREGKFWGKALEPSVFCDEAKVADMDNGRYFALKLDPGQHVIRSNDKDTEVAHAFEAGKTYYVRISIKTGMAKGHGRIELVEADRATKEMKKLKPLDREKVADSKLVKLEPIK